MVAARPCHLCDAADFSAVKLPLPLCRMFDVQQHCSTLQLSGRTLSLVTQIDSAVPLTTRRGCAQTQSTLSTVGTTAQCRKRLSYQCMTDVRCCWVLACQQPCHA